MTSVFIYHFSDIIIVTKSLLQSLFESKGSEKETIRAIYNLLEKQPNTLSLFIDISDKWLLNDGLPIDFPLRILRQCVMNTEICHRIGELNGFCTYMNKLVLTNDNNLIQFVYPIIMRIDANPTFAQNASKSGFVTSYIEYSLRSNNTENIINCINCVEFILRKSFIVESLLLVNTVAALLTNYSKDERIRNPCMAFIYTIYKYQESSQALLNANIFQLVQQITQNQ